MKKFLALVLLNIFFLFSHSQNYKIYQIKGIVLNTENKPLSYTFIYDSLLKKGYLANDIGEFDFFTINNNTIIFSHLGYKPQKIRISIKDSQQDIYFLKVFLIADTIFLKPVNIFPWRNYEQFVLDFLTAKIPDDDYQRAKTNFNILKYQIQFADDEMFASANISYRFSLFKYTSDLYWKGQTQPLQIFNIIAWQEFLQYLREGKFKTKKRNN
ncbi:MAG: hypothetical protein N3A01_01385 [Bacteroidales bacterium]|nr:hypothetical protein [Bacteroidales bacterium]